MKNVELDRVRTKTIIEPNNFELPVQNDDEDRDEDDDIWKKIISKKVD